MHLRLHKNATTTPRIRAEIQVSKEPMRVLAQRFGVSVSTIARWKKRASVHDASHTPHRLQTTLTPAQESIVLVLRKSLGLSLDDLLAVVREFIHPTVSRAALHRMLKRHGVSAREALSVDRPRTKPFKAYEPGFVHIDVKYLPQMADETTRRYLFVAIDRATRWVFVRVYASKSATNARRFLKELHKAAAFRIRTILTDNGKEFTDRFITRGERTPTGRHQFDQLCEELGIEHRLTRPKHPQTNGMVERFNGRIADILRTHHFHSGEELEATILRYVWLYNHQLPQKALGHVSPIQAMKQWQRSHPELFNRRVTNQPGHDSFVILVAMATKLIVNRHLWPSQGPSKMLLSVEERGCARGSWSHGHGLSAGTGQTRRTGKSDIARWAEVGRIPARKEYCGFIGDGVRRRQVPLRPNSPAARRGRGAPCPASAAAPGDG